MKQRSSKRIWAALLIATALVATYAQPNAWAADVAQSFWNNSTYFNVSNVAVLAASEAQFNQMEENDLSLENFIVANKVSGSGTTMTIRPTRHTNAYFSAFLTSSRLNAAFYKAGGKTIRYEITGLAVERQASAYPDSENYTFVRRWDSEVRGSVSELYTVISVSEDAAGSDNEHPFSLRFELSGNYKATDLQLVTIESGELIEVDTTIRVTKAASSDRYFARTGQIYDGVYCLLKKSR